MTRTCVGGVVCAPVALTVDFWNWKKKNTKFKLDTDSLSARLCAKYCANSSLRQSDLSPQIRWHDACTPSIDAKFEWYSAEYYMCVCVCDIAWTLYFNLLLYNTAWQGNNNHQAIYLHQFFIAFFQNWFHICCAFRPCPNRTGANATCRMRMNQSESVTMCCIHKSSTIYSMPDDVDGATSTRCARAHITWVRANDDYSISIYSVYYYYYC